MGKKRKKCKNETFNQTVNRMRALAKKDLNNGKIDPKDRPHTGYSTWEWEIYDLVWEQWKLKERFKKMEQRIAQQLEEGDDF